MRLTYPTALLLPLLPSLATAVSLSDFSPRNTNLTPECASVYTQQITACTPTDFRDLSVSICSTRCLAGVLAIQTLVQDFCALDAVDSDTIIGLFLAGLGTRTVCPQTNRLVDNTPPAATISHSIPDHPGPTIGSSTLRLSEVTSSATGLLVETSPSPVRTRSGTASSSPSSEEPTTTSAAPTSTAAPTTTAPSERPVGASSTTAALVDTGIASGVRPTVTSSSSAEARQTGGGGGGSLLDVGQNGAAGRSRGVGMWVWGVSFAALGWMFGGGMV